MCWRPGHGNSQDICARAWKSALRCRKDVLGHDDVSKRLEIVGGLFDAQVSDNEHAICRSKCSSYGVCDLVSESWNESE